MAFGVYVHTPFCLQRCTYCDFATFEVGDSRIGSSKDYLDLVHHEIRTRHSQILAHFPQIDTLYLGGGTPSLLEPHDILAIKTSLSQAGFIFSNQLEWTIEINPATISQQKLKAYQDIGINRFSLGVQSFEDEQLKRAGRRHNAQQTRETLSLLSGLNFNMDLLFALPHQSVDSLLADLEEFLKWQPKHISPYCLTVPNSNPMAAHRPNDEQQVHMFELIRNKLTESGYVQYEISNYAWPGFESRHNQLYWTDESYWGIGLSSHSYIKNGQFGVRFWNPPQYPNYKAQVLNDPPAGQPWPYDFVPKKQRENLQIHEALTDYCHTALRTSEGLSCDGLERKFSQEILRLIEERLRTLPPSWIEKRNNHWILTREGQVLSNQVFEKIYLSADQM